MISCWVRTPAVCNYFASFAAGVLFYSRITAYFNRCGAGDKSSPLNMCLRLINYFVMKQGFVFLISLTVLILVTGLFEGCGNRGDAIVITNDQLEEIIGYYPDRDKTDSTFNMIVYLGLQPDANRDSLTNVWNNHIYNPDNAEYVVEVAFNNNVAPINVTQEMFNKRYNY